MTFTVAITGRPNVGKSTLFNRLVGKRSALVSDVPGVTRDRRKGEARLADLTFTVIDTAGLDEVSGETLEARMRRQTEAAIDEADAALFLIDAQSGVTPLDHHFAGFLRRRHANTVLVANKCDSAASDDGYREAFSLGMGDPIAVSAEHGEGLGDLYRALAAALSGNGRPSSDDAVDQDAPRDARPLKLAVVGRPNVGKSTFVNRLLGQERVVTGPEVGITRDSISVDWKWRGRRVELFDTAGVRKRARVDKKLEKLSVSDTLRAVRFADAVVLLLDFDRAFDKQDLRIADLIVREGRALVIAVNKWDLAPKSMSAWPDLKEKTERLLPQIRGVPLVKISALYGEGMDTVMPAVERVHKDWSAFVKTSDLNRWLGEIEARHPPPAVKGRRIRLRYMSQVGTRPPSFLVFSSRAAHLPESYRRYLVNHLRDAFGLPGVPVRLTFRQGKNPYTAD